MRRYSLGNGIDLFQSSKVWLLHVSVYGKEELMTGDDEDGRPDAAGMGSSQR